MLVIGGMVFGALAGGFTARRRGGTRADIAQYAAVWGILFALVGLFLTLFLDRMLRG